MGDSTDRQLPDAQSLHSRPPVVRSTQTHVSLSDLQFNLSKKNTQRSKRAVGIEELQRVISDLQRDPDLQRLFEAGRETVTEVGAEGTLEPELRLERIPATAGDAPKPRFMVVETITKPYVASAAASEAKAGERDEVAERVDESLLAEPVLVPRIVLASSEQLATERNSEDLRAQEPPVAGSYEVAAHIEAETICTTSADFVEGSHTALTLPQPLSLQLDESGADPVQDTSEGRVDAIGAEDPKVTAEPEQQLTAKSAEISEFSDATVSRSTYRSTHRAEHSVLKLAKFEVAEIAGEERPQSAKGEKLSARKQSTLALESMQTTVPPAQPRTLQLTNLHGISTVDTTGRIAEKKPAAEPRKEEFSVGTETVSISLSVHNLPSMCLASERSEGKLERKQRSIETSTADQFTEKEEPTLSMVTLPCEAVSPLESTSFSRLETLEHVSIPAEVTETQEQACSPRPLTPAKPRLLTVSTAAGAEIQSRVSTPRSPEIVREETISVFAPAVCSRHTETKASVSMASFAMSVYPPAKPRIDIVVHSPENEPSDLSDLSPPSSIFPARKPSLTIETTCSDAIVHPQVTPIRRRKRLKGPKELGSDCSQLLHCTPQGSRVIHVKEYVIVDSGEKGKLYLPPIYATEIPQSFAPNERSLSKPLRYKPAHINYESDLFEKPFSPFKCTKRIQSKDPLTPGKTLESSRKTLGTRRSDLAQSSHKSLQSGSIRSGSESPVRRPGRLKIRKLKLKLL